MNQLFTKKMRAITFIGAIGVLSFTLVAKPTLKTIKAYLNPTISYTLNGEKVLADAKTITYDNRTYVPLADVAKLMDIQTKYKNGTIIMTTRKTEELPKDVQPIVIPKAIIKKVSEENKTVTILKAGDEDKYENYVILNIFDKTIIQGETDKKAYTLKELKQDMEISVKHSPIMTASLPAQTLVFEIKVITKDQENKEDQAVVISKATIKEVSEENKRVTILKAGDEDKYENYIILNISDKTSIVDETDKKVYTLKELKPGMEISVKHSLAMTFSIPPQTSAFEIKVISQDQDDKNKEDNDKEESILKDIKILEVNHSGKYIVVENGRKDGKQIKALFDNKTKVKYQSSKKQPNANSLKIGQTVDLKLDLPISSDTSQVKIAEISVKEQ